MDFPDVLAEVRHSQRLNSASKFLSAENWL